jgi:hypothetical protein
MKLPRVLRLARSLTYAHQNPQRELDTFNRGFTGNPNANIPDALRGSFSRMGHSKSEVDQIYQAALNSPRKRG